MTSTFAPIRPQSLNYRPDTGGAALEALAADLADHGVATTAGSLGRSDFGTCTLDVLTLTFTHAGQRFIAYADPAGDETVALAACPMHWGRPVWALETSVEIPADSLSDAVWDMLDDFTTADHTVAA